MCMTLQPAELSNTKLYVGEARRGDTYVHVMAYQNKAATAGPNAMILPIPTAKMPGPENVIDTRDFRHFLDELQEVAALPDILCFGAHDEDLEAAQVFAVGSYTVVLAEKAYAIERAVGRLPEKQRPVLNPDILHAFEQLYEGWPLAVCCWDGSIEAEPLLWWYEPKMPDVLFAPALDAHDGGPPNINRMVMVDHGIVFGSALDRSITPHFRYRDRARIPPSVLALLPTTVRGTMITEELQNGDFWCPTNGRSDMMLRRAPGATKPSDWIPLSVL